MHYSGVVAPEEVTTNHQIVDIQTAILLSPDSNRSKQLFCTRLTFKKGSPSELLSIVDRSQDALHWPGQSAPPPPSPRYGASRSPPGEGPLEGRGKPRSGCRRLAGKLVARQVTQHQGMHTYIHPFSKVFVLLPCQRSPRPPRSGFAHSGESGGGSNEREWERGSCCTSRKTQKEKHLKPWLGKSCDTISSVLAELCD